MFGADVSVIERFGFFRGERELTRKHKGTGIGLSLVRGLVQRMGGSVSGQNTNPGFEVSVTLP